MPGLPTANECAQKLLWLSRALDTGADELAAADEAYVRAKARFEVARVTAVMRYAEDFRGDKTVLAVEREAHVSKEIGTQALDVELAEQRVRTLKEKQRVLFAQVEIARSLNAGLRADAHLAAAS